MHRANKIVFAIVCLALLLGLTYECVKWTVMRVYVDKDEALVVINKFGDPLPPEDVVVPASNNRYKGVEEEVRGPGRYFLDPFEYDTQIVKQIEIPAGDPTRWSWDGHGLLKDPSAAPMVGVVTLKQGKDAAPGLAVVPDGYRGIQEHVLTPGTYKINPYLCEVKLEPAVVVPPGSVGVVTRLVGDSPPLLARAPTTQSSDKQQPQLVSDPNMRGILRDVLQPGLYYLNPRLVQVTVVPVGYDQITLQQAASSAIQFTSNDAYQVTCDLTVVWGRTPADAPNIVATIGNTDQVQQYVIAPAMKAACQNEGGRFTAKELIQGSTRSRFQDELTASLEHDVADRHLRVLLALVRNVSITDSVGHDATMGLLATIQQANIEIETDLTNKQKTQTAMVAAQLQQADRQVDVARETVAAETNVKVAQVLADGQKQAAQIGAQQELDVATIQQQVAQLDAQRTEIMGQANAQVVRMKSDAEAEGARLSVQALGSPQAYNFYTFAQHFAPDDLRIIFAGPGTFWTDLKSTQEIGAMKLMQTGASAEQR